LFYYFSMSVLPHIRGNKRRQLLSQHRLNEFERVFDRYRDGKTSAEHVAQRARKLNAGKKDKPRKRYRKNAGKYR